MAKGEFDKIAYNNAFNAKAYDRINLTVPKGQKQAIQDHAAKKRESVNAYIWRLIREDMNKGS